MRKIALFFAVICTFSNVAAAKVELPNLFCDGMVVQRNSPLVINGKADKNEIVKVFWRGREIETEAKGGVWSVTLEAGGAGGPFTIRANDAIVRDIYVGDVYLCSGQSNMEMRLGDCMDVCADYVNGYSNGLVRYFKVPRELSFDALHFDVGKAEWKKLENGNTADWSAIAYFTGRQMQEAENIPIGIIDASYGGTPIEAWMDEWSLADFDSAQAMMKESREKETLVNPYLYPCGCFNAMICPILNRHFSGVIWYQGEGNVGNADEYDKLLKTMISSWREYLEQENLPFYIVELAKFGNSDQSGKFPEWNMVQKQQKAVCDEMSNCHFIKNGDLGDNEDIHPHCKKEVADRIVKQIKASKKK